MAPFGVIGCLLMIGLRFVPPQHPPVRKAEEMLPTPAQTPADV
jgi:hypothetical protein